METMTKMTTSSLVEITDQVYRSMGLSVDTDESADELIASELSAAGIEIDEDYTPDHADVEYTRHAVRRALKTWNREGM